VAHAWIALSADTAAVRAAAKQRLVGYTRMPFYTTMFATAGYPLEADGSLSDALVDSLTIRGDEAAVVARIDELLAAGLDELLLTPLPIGDEEAERERLFGIIGQL
jgi:alkanesulfonate monooxygenase SsuD/methylene tetrahydromethanopterin reductase-like flavin-dependent oxidoreductase (luciferase family)